MSLITTSFHFKLFIILDKLTIFFGKALGKFQILFM